MSPAPFTVPLHRIFSPSGFSGKQGMEFHEVANIFPLMDGTAFEQLVADVKANGLREPIWKHEEKIIDGRNRWRACGEAGVEPRFQEWDGKGSLVSFVVSLNLHRRHLSDSQRAMVAAKIANMKDGNPNRKDSTSPIGEVAQVSNESAAALLNVSVQSVTRGRKVREFAVPELIAAVERGEVSVSAAAAVAEVEPERQQKLVAAGPDAIVSEARKIRFEDCRREQAAPEPRPEKKKDAPKPDAWASDPELAKCITDLERFCSMPSYQLSVIELKRITTSLKSSLQRIL
jgi:hypothetical protein